MNGLLVAVLLSAFHFNTPEGWTDFSRCPDEAALMALPEAVAEDARRMCVPTDGGTPQMKSSALFAVDLRRLEQENAVATMNVVVLPGAVKLDGGTAGVMARGLAEAAAKNGDKMEVVDAVLVDIGEQRGAKLRFLRPYRSDRLDMYVIPHDEQTAMLSFISPIARYEEYEPVFAVTAHQAVVPDPFTKGLKILAFVSVCFGALFGYYLFIGRRRRKRSP